MRILSPTYLSSLHHLSEVHCGAKRIIMNAVVIATLKACQNQHVGAVLVVVCDMHAYHLSPGADAETLLAKCLPLGASPHLRSIMTFENFDNADGLVELYRTVLIDTPVAPYFEKYFNSEVT